jgi:hypothetical protein
MPAWTPDTSAMLSSTAGLPLSTNVLFITVMANQMPFVAR